MISHLYWNHPPLNFFPFFSSLVPIHTFSLVVCGLHDKLALNMLVFHVSVTYLCPIVFFGNLDSRSKDPKFMDDELFQNMTFLQKRDLKDEPVAVNFHRMCMQIAVFFCASNDIFNRVLT